jgi:chromate transporter
MHDHALQEPFAPPTVAEIFIGFLTLGLTAFGGALPLARREIVERRKWLTSDEFVDLLGLCQFLPGGNVINLLGLIVGPSLIVIGLGVLYQRTHQDPHIRHLFAGLAAAAAGLLVSMAIKVAWPLRRKLSMAAVAALAFIAIALLRLPLLPVMLVLTPVSIFVASRVNREVQPEMKPEAKPEVKRGEGQ